MPDFIQDKADQLFAISQTTNLEPQAIESAPQAPPRAIMSYQVFVDDNFHYMEQEHRSFLGEFETFEAAVEACKQVVHRCLEDTYKPGMSADELSALYGMYGDEPFIIGGYPRFSAREYAREQAERIAQESK